MSAKKCIICNQPFSGRRDAKTCSPRCRKRLQLVRMSVVMEPESRSMVRVAALNVSKPAVLQAPAPLEVINPQTPVSQNNITDTGKTKAEMKGKWLASFTLGLFGILSLLLAMLPSPAARAATSSNLNFQARLLTNTGAVVPDGSYNVEFKIYKSLSAGTSAQGVCAGGVTDDCLWLETRTGANTVSVVNGYLSANLGSVSAFGSINWDQPLWLSMRIGGIGAPSWDSEMSPRIALTALPYSFVAGQLAKTDGSSNRGTLGFNTVANNPAILLPDASGTVCLQSATACGFAPSVTNGYVQLAPGVVQADATTNNSIFINKTTGTGNIFELQKSASDVFLIDNSGNVTSSGTVVIQPTSPTTAPLTVNATAPDIASGSLIDIPGFLSSSTNDQSAIKTHPAVNPSVNSTRVYSGATFNLSTNSSHVSGATLRGTDSAVSFSGTTTLGTAQAGRYRVQNTSTGTITNAYGVQIAAPSNSGTFTNTYGLYVDSQTAGTQTNTPYGIYQAGATDLNFFAGATTIMVGSTTAFQVQNASNNAVLTVDTSGNQTVLGKASSLDGLLTFNTSAGANTVSLKLAASPTTSYTLLLPTLAPTTSQCLQSDASVSNQLVFASCSGTGSGVAIGTIDTPSKSSDGAHITGSTLYFQTADASFPGLVSTGTQTFAGAKTFSTSVSAGTSLDGLTISNPTDTNIANAIKRGLVITSGAITENTAANTGTYVGADITNPALTLTTGTALNAYGLRVTTGTQTQSTGTLTQNGIYVDTGNGVSSGTLNGININVGNVSSGTFTYKGLRISTNGVARTFTASGSVMGIDVDLSNNVTADGIGLIGVNIATPADTSMAGATKRGLYITSGALTTNTATTGTYVGTDISMPGLTTNTSASAAINAYGLRVTTGNTSRTVGSINEYGLYVDNSATSLTSSTSLSGLYVDNGGSTPGNGSTLNGIAVNLGGFSTSATVNGISIAANTARTIGAGANGLTGLNMDLSTNITATGASLMGMKIQLPGDTSITTATKTGLSVSYTGTNTVSSANTGTVVGADISLGGLSTTNASAALNAYGLRISTTSSYAQTSGTLKVYGLYVNSAASSFNSGSMTGAQFRLPAAGGTAAYTGLSISADGNSTSIATSGNVTGINVDLNSNITYNATGGTTKGIAIAMPGDPALSAGTKIGLSLTSGALTVNNANTGTFVGTDITIPGLTTSTNAGAVLNAYGLRVTTGSQTQTNGTLTQNGLFVDSSINAPTSGTLNGVKISTVNDPGSSLASTGLTIGSGWDTGIKIDSPATTGKALQITTTGASGAYGISITSGSGSAIVVANNVAATSDIVSIDNSAAPTTTNGLNGVYVHFVTTGGASGDAFHITPGYTGGATDALTYNGIELDGFSPTNAAGTDAVNGVKIGNLTDPGATITSSAITIGTGWDKQVNGNGWSVDGSGNLVVAGCTGCGGGTLASTYNSAATTGNTITYTTAGAGIVIQDASTPLTGNMLTIQNNAGTSNYLTLSIASGVPHLKVYDSTGANYADIYYSGGAAIFAASSGTTQVGQGTGSISFALGAEGDTITVNKSVSLTANKTSAYSDFTITRAFTQSTFTTTGSSVLKVEDTSTATSAGNIAPDVLLVSQGNASAGGNIINAQAGGTSIFAVSSPGSTNAGNVVIANSVSIGAGKSYTGSGAVTLSSAAATALTLTGNAASTWSTSAGAITLQGYAGVNVDTGSAAAINIGSGSNATSVGICNSANCDTINIGTNADADAINIGDSTDTTTIAGTVKLSGATNCTSLKTDGTGTISCGDGPDTAAFTDSTPGTMANNTTTELFNDATKPSITPISTAQTVLVSVSVRAHGATNTPDSSSQVRIVHNAGSAASCSTSSQVGDLINVSFTTNNGTGEFALGSGTFLDSPATTSQEFYTVCSNAMTGTQTVDQVTVTLVTLGADYAENYYTTDSSIVAGDIVSIDSSLPAGAKKSNGSYDKNVLGIVSTAPFKVADDKIGANFGRAIPVALSGRVPVRVTTENGPIKVGDLLTTSATVPGAAMKATRAGQVVGQAMTVYSGSGVGQIFAFVKTDYSNGPSINDLMTGLSIVASDGSTTSTNLSTDLLSGLVNLANQQTAPVSVSDITTDRLAAAIEIVTPKVTTDQLLVNSIGAATGTDIKLKLGDNGQFVVTNGAGDNVITFDAAGNATFAGTVTADKVKANQIEGLSVLTDKIDSLSAVLSANTGSGDVSQASGSTQNTGSNPLSGVGGISLSNVSFQNATVMLDLNVMGSLVANGSLTVQGDASFLGNVSFGRHIFTTGDTPDLVLELGAGITLAPIDNPDAKLATANVDGNDISGQLTVKLGDNANTGKLITLTFKKPYAKAPKVLLTPANDSAASVQYYVQSTATGFTITIISGQLNSGSSLLFNYWATE